MSALATQGMLSFPKIGSLNKNNKLGSSSPSSLNLGFLSSQLSGLKISFNPSDVKPISAPVFTPIVPVARKIIKDLFRAAVWSWKLEKDEFFSKQCGNWRFKNEISLVLLDTQSSELFPVSDGRICPLTGKKANRANKVSFSNHKTKKLQFVNLQYKRVWWEAGNRFVKLRLSTKAIKTIEKNGLDAVAKKAGIDLRKL
ncbi:hypothetical protein ACFE04_013013 [Oxalis oulophora]